MYVCIYVCVSVHLCVCASVCMCVSVSVHLCVCAYVCLCVYVKCLQRPEEGVRSHRARVRGGCKPPDEDAGN